MLFINLSPAIFGRSSEAFTNVLQAWGGSLTQEDIHVDFIPLDPNTHFMLKSLHHVHKKMDLTLDSVFMPY